jgi:DNA polymerase III subunit beta
MKVICDRGALVDALALAQGVVASRTPKPVLKCVKLTASADEGLTLEATDAETALRLTTPRVEVAEPGECVVPADKLTAIVRESIDATITLSADAEQTHITGSDSKFKVLGYPPAEFPVRVAFTGAPDFEVSAAELHKLVAQTLFATAKENSRYAINGVLIEREGNKLSVVATDGHRLAIAKGACKAGDDKQPRSTIVPSRALNLLLRLFDDAEQTVSVKLDDNRILFKTDTAVLASNLVEGNFPPYKDIIPKDNDKRATLNTDAFISAIRRTALLTNEESKGVRMAFGKDGATLSSRAPEMGEAEVRLELADYQGDAIEIGFNPAYLLDALKVVDAQEVVLEMRAPSKPGIVKTGPNFTYIVMPVNLA